MALRAALEKATVGKTISRRLKQFISLTYHEGNYLVGGSVTANDFYRGGANAAGTLGSSRHQATKSSVELASDPSSHTSYFGGKYSDLDIQYASQGEGVLSVRDDLKFIDEWHSGVTLKEGVLQGEKGNALYGLYVDLSKSNVPEHKAEFYHRPELTKAKVHQKDFGCKGASAEFELTKKTMCMYRNSVEALARQVLDSESSRRKDIYVDGWKGSGKSMALYALVSLAREMGWVVMYVPSASLLVEGGTYKKKDESDPMWYTPVAANHILRAVHTAHKEQLDNLPSADEKASLSALCSRGIETKDAIEKVDIAVDVLKGILQGDGTNGIRTLVVIDGYNYLYHRTEYHETVHQFHRRRILPDELKLTSSFRVLEHERSSGVAVVSPCYSESVSSSIQIPGGLDAQSIRVPRYSLNEVASVCNMLISQKVIPELPPDRSLRRMLALTNGNGSEIRKNCVSLFRDDCGIPLSFGYKSKLS
eukprot:jgi/Picsp_1/2113/NSC_05578-R1_28s ribosomal protein mitochondrial-like